MQIADFIEDSERELEEQFLYSRFRNMAGIGRCCMLFLLHPNRHRFIAA
jgi:hypothetical protein